MCLIDSINREIHDMKSLISEIDKHSDDSKFFYDLSQKADWLAHDIDKVHSGYYVAFVESGPDDNFVRIYYPLGFMTASKAHEILNTEFTVVEPWNSSGVREVSKEVMDKYYSLINIQQTYKTLYANRYALTDILPDGFMNRLKNKLDQLRHDVGFKYTWEYVASRYEQ